MSDFFHGLGSALGSFADWPEEHERKVAEAKAAEAAEAERARRIRADRDAAFSRVVDDFLAGAAGAPRAAAAPAPDTPFLAGKAGTLTDNPAPKPFNNPFADAFGQGRNLPPVPLRPDAYSTTEDKVAEPPRPTPSMADLRSSLGFSWGKDVPLSGGRPTFDSMLQDLVTQNAVRGRESIGGGGYSGPAVGSGASIEDWQKNVANPMAFSAFREIPEIAKMEAERKMAETLAEDPFARERTQGEIDVNKARGISGAQQEREEGRRDAFYERMAEMIDADVARGIAQIQAHPNFTKMSPQEQRSLLETVKQRGEQAKRAALLQSFGIGQGLRVPELYQQDTIGAGG